MECLDWRERISALIDGEVPSSEARLIEAHLEACAECRAVERKMRAVGIGVARTEGTVPSDFREKLFARLEAEELLPRRRNLFVYSLRWAAIPATAAAAFALFLLVSSEKGQEPVSVPAPLPRVVQQAPVTETREPAAPAVSPDSRSAVAPRQQAPPARLTGEELTAEEREIVAYLDILEDPSELESPDEVDEMEIFAPSGRSRG